MGESWDETHWVGTPRMVRLLRWEDFVRMWGRTKLSGASDIGVYMRTTREQWRESLDRRRD